MHTSTHSTSFLFPGPFPWQSSLSLTMRIQFCPVGGRGKPLHYPPPLSPLILPAASCSYVYVACAALARSCKCSVLHGVVPQPAANDAAAAARQNVAALIECTSSLPARIPAAALATPAAAAPFAPAVAVAAPFLLLLPLMGSTLTAPSLPSITTCDALNLSALSVSVERRSAFQSVRADCRPSSSSTLHSTALSPSSYLSFPSFACAVARYTNGVSLVPSAQTTPDNSWQFLRDVLQLFSCIECSAATLIGPSNWLTSQQLSWAIKQRLLHV